MRTVENIKPKAIASRTNAQLYDQGITYNEAGVTYNDIYAYGGVYGYDIIPSIALASENSPRISAIGDFPNTLPITILGRGQPMGLLLALTYPATEVTFL